MPWPLDPKSEAAVRAGGVEAVIAADAASSTVKVTHRINSSSSGRHGTSKSSSCSSSGSSIFSDINRRGSSTSRGSSSTQGVGVYYAFVSGVVNPGTFCLSAAQYPLH